MIIVNKGKCFILALVTVGSTSSIQNQSQSQSLECYEYPSCTATEFYDPVTGFTNDTGFAAPESSECCQVIMT